MTRRRRGTIAAITRNQVTAVAVVDGGQVVLVKRYILRPGDNARVATKVKKLHTDYHAKRVVTEHATSLQNELQQAQLQAAGLTLPEVKQALLDQPSAEHGQLYDHVVEQHPELQRFVRLLPGKYQVARGSWRCTVVLLAVALALSLERIAQY